MLAETIQQEWINTRLIKRTHRFIPTGMTNWSAGSLLSTVPGVSAEADFLQAINELSQLTGSPKPVSAKKRVRISKRLYDTLQFLNASESEFTPATPYQILSVVEVFLQGGAIWTSAEFWELYRWTTTQFMYLLSTRESNVGANATLVNVMVLEGELPWLAGLLYSKVPAFNEYGKAGQKVLRKALKSQLDTDGTPSATIVDQLADWLAPLVRCTFWGSVFEQPLWKTKQEELYDQLLERAAQFCRPSGRLAFSTDGAESHAEMLRHAMQQTGFAYNSKPLKYVTQIASTPIASRNGLVVKSRKWGSVKNSISTQSDWAELASMRTSWALDADSLLVTHHESIPQLEMSILGDILFQGAWDLDVRINGQKRKLTTDWECACWYSDREVDYLEVAFPISDEVHINRQFVLSREDHFAVLMESVSQTGDKKVELSSRLPLAAGVKVMKEESTREFRLMTGTHSVRVFPLGQPQYKSASCSGEVVCNESTIEQKQSGTGAALNVLFFDWHPRRSRELVEWRNLSITENRRILPSGEAFAARLRLKNRQWLLFRSLKSGWEWPRAVLGLHTNYETVLGRFDSKGNIVPIVNVE
ncbi:MAG: hypothetical protein R3C11_14990 [Planctomycetaceae bacterium]